MEQTYKDHTITFTRDWRFVVAGPLFADNSGTMTFDSLAEAKLAIDNRILADAKQRKAVLDIKVLNDRGELRTATGVHLGHGNLLGVGETVYVYPANSATLREMLQRFAVLQDEVQRLIKETMPYRIAVRRTYGRTRAEEYDALVQKFTDELAEKSSKAAAL